MQDKVACMYMPVEYIKLYFGDPRKPSTFINEGDYAYSFTDYHWILFL